MVNPGAQDLDKEIRRIEEKIEAGARFFQTQAVYDPGSLPGLAVPEGIIQELEKAVSPADRSVEVAARVIGEIKEMCGGVHVIAMGWESRVPGVLGVESQEVV